MTYTGENGQLFSHNGYIEKNLDKIKQWVQKRNKDFIIIMTGGEGNGKSALSQYTAKYLDPEFPLENVALTHKQYIKKVKNQAENSVIVHDEGHDSFYSRNAMTKKNKEAMAVLRKYRFKNHIHIINIPDISEIEKPLLRNRAHSLIRVVRQGWFWFFNKQQIKQIEIEREGIDWPDYSFRDGFSNPAKKMPEHWKEYENHKKEALKEEEQDEEDESVSVDAAIEVVKKNYEDYVREYQGRKYIDKDLIEHEFGLSRTDARKVKKIVEKDLTLQ